MQDIQRIHRTALAKYGDSSRKNQLLLGVKARFNNYSALANLDELREILCGRGIYRPIEVSEFLLVFTLSVWLIAFPIFHATPRRVNTNTSTDLFQLEVLRASPLQFTWIVKWISAVPSWPDREALYPYHLEEPRFSLRAMYLASSSHS